MRMGATIERWFVRVVSAILALFAFIAIAINIVNAIGRTYFGAPLDWADEVLSYGFMWAVFLGSALLVLRDDHIRIDLASNFLPRRAIKAVRALLLIITGLFCGYVALHSYEVVESALRSGRRSVVVGMPMSWAHGSIFFGFVFMSLLALLRGGADILRLIWAPKDL